MKLLKSLINNSLLMVLLMGLLIIPVATNRMMTVQQGNSNVLPAKDVRLNTVIENKDATYTDEVSLDFPEEQSTSPSTIILK